MTTWDNGGSRFPTALGNCCESHRGFGTKPLPHPRYPDSWGWRLWCSAPLSRDLYWYGISGLLARFFPLTRVLFAVDVIFLVRNKGRRAVILPSPARRAIHPAGQPLPHSAGHRRWQRDLFSWDNSLCFYGRMIRQGDAWCTLQARVPLGQPEPFFQVTRIFWFVFSNQSKDAEIVVRLTAGLLQLGSGFMWHISHCIHWGAARLLCQGSRPAWSRGAVMVLQLKLEPVSHAQPHGA